MWSFLRRLVFGHRRPLPSRPVSTGLNLDAYIGKWVVINNNRVVVSADNLKDLMAALDAAKTRDPSLKGGAVIFVELDRAVMRIDALAACS